MEVEELFRDTRLNMLLAWASTAVIGLVFVESVLDLDFLWSLFSGLLISLIILPPVYYRDVRAVLPFELLAIAAIPVIVRVFEVSILANEVATYVSFAAMALLIAVELHIFTSVSFSHGFSVAFLLVSTLAVGAVWSSVAGLLAGLLFDIYFRRRDNMLRSSLRRLIRR